MSSDVITPATIVNSEELDKSNNSYSPEEVTGSQVENTKSSNTEAPFSHTEAKSGEEEEAPFFLITNRKSGRQAKNM